jgi:upstream activation factor subunit UAF30
MTDRMKLVATAKTSKTTPAKAAEPTVAAKTAKPAVAKSGKAAAAPAVKPNALQKPLTPSPELATVVGEAMLSRGEVVKKVWEYIRAHNLQNPADKREILADEKLQKVFGRDKCTMFEMNKYLALHLK